MTSKQTDESSTKALVKSPAPAGTRSNKSLRDIRRSSGLQTSYQIYGHRPPNLTAVDLNRAGFAGDFIS